MNRYDQRTPLSKALMTGLCTGLAATVLSLFYNIIFRFSTNYPLSAIINVSSIIFLINLIFIFIGLFYFFIHKVSARGDLIYIVLTVVVAIIVLWLTAVSNRSENARYAHEFRGLLTGILIIMTVNALLIPYLISKKWFEEFFL